MKEASREKFLGLANVLAFAVVTVAVLGMTFTSCSAGPTNEERLTDAREDFDEAQSIVETKLAALDEARSDAAKLTEELEKARKHLDETKAQVRDAAADMRIYHEVEAALLNDARFIGRDLTVRVKDATVTIRGEVATSADIRAVEQRVGGIQGVRAVDLEDLSAERSDPKVKKAS